MQFTTQGVVVFLCTILVAGCAQCFLQQQGSYGQQSTRVTPRPLQVSLVRIVGYAVGNDIQGQFQLVVDGPTNLTHVTIHFNQTLVYNTTQPQFSWSFQTNDYPLGWTIICVQGFDPNDSLYEWQINKRFVPSDVNTPYWIAALLFMIIFSSAIIVAKIQQLRHNSPP